MSAKSRTLKMTEGNALPLILRFAIPIMVGNLFQMLYSMVDTAVVGRAVGPDALAAVGTTAPVTDLLLGLMIGMSSGMGVVIAQHFGAGNLQKVRAAVTNGICLLALLCAAVSVGGVLCCRTLFGWINTPPEILDDAVTYTVILFSGGAASAAYNFEAAILRAFGNSRIPLLFLILTSVLNVGLDLLLVLAAGMGVTGVALATVISQGISAVLCFVYLRRRVPEVQLAKADWRWSPELLRQHLRTGVPMAFFSSLLAISFLVLQAALNSLGMAEIAAYTAASRMDSLVYQVLGAFGTAVSTFAAQNYGCGAMDRVREGSRKCLGITVAISLGLTVLVQLFGGAFMRLFVAPEETAVLACGTQYLRTTSLLYFVLGINFIIRFELTGVGETMIPMAVGICEILTRAAVTYFLVYRIGFTGMTVASPCCWVTSTVLCLLCYRPGMRRAEQRQLAAA